MKTRKLVLACVSALALLGMNTTIAGNRPGAFTVSLADAYYHFADKRHLHNINLPNAALAYDFDSHWAIEGGAGLINTDSKGSKHHHHHGVHGYLYTLDGLYRFKQYRAIEPYISAGIGVLSLKPNGNDAKQQGNINAGIGAQWFFHDSIALRAEARDIYTMVGGKNDFMVNLGISFLFGGESQPCQPKVASYKGEKLA